MKNIDDFLDEVKKVTKSDYRTAAVLNTERQKVSGWRARRFFPRNKEIIQLCEIADLDLKSAILAVEYSRENERPMKQAGFADIGLMGWIGAGSLAALSLDKVTALPYEAIGAVIMGLNVVYYVK